MIRFAAGWGAPAKDVDAPDVVRVSAGTKAYSAGRHRHPDHQAPYATFAIVTFDGENFGENRLQAQVLALGGGDVGLEKLPIRIGLQFDQVRRRDDLFDLTEVYSFSGSRWHFDLYHCCWHTGQTVCY